MGMSQSEVYARWLQPACIVGMTGPTRQALRAGEAKAKTISELVKRMNEAQCEQVSMARAPSVVNRAPSVMARAPSVMARAPSVVNRAPSVVNRAPSVVNRAPSYNIRRSPFNMPRTGSNGPQSGGMSASLSRALGLPANASLNVKKAPKKARKPKANKEPKAKKPRKKKAQKDEPLARALSAPIPQQKLEALQRQMSLPMPGQQYQPLNKRPLVKKKRQPKDPKETLEKALPKLRTDLQNAIHAPWPSSQELRELMKQSVDALPEYRYSASDKRELRRIVSMPYDSMRSSERAKFQDQAFLALMGTPKYRNLMAVFDRATALDMPRLYPDGFQKLTRAIQNDLGDAPRYASDQLQEHFGASTGQLKLNKVVDVYRYAGRTKAERAANKARALGAVEQNRREKELRKQQRAAAKKSLAQ